MKRVFSSLIKNQRGQSFVELGISLVFLLVFLSAVIDLGWGLYTIVAMRDSVQEGAGFASFCQNTNSISKRIKGSATAPLNIEDITDMSIEYYDENNNPGGVITYGYTVKVSLTVNHKIVTPFVGAFIGNKQGYPLKVSATDTIMQLATNCQ